MEGIETTYIKNIATVFLYSYKTHICCKFIYSKSRGWGANRWL